MSSPTDIRPTDILIERPGGHRLLITLDRPKVRNALRGQTLTEIAAALAAAAADPELRVAVLTGGASVFAAGADLDEMAAHDAVSIRSDARPALWRAIRAFPKPLIAAVNGWCLGGGCELAMLADMIVAGETARFGQPEINLGIMPGAGGTQRLPRAVGKSLAMRMVLTGEPIDARTALAAGLVVEVAPPELTVERALALAATIAAKPPLAVQAAKAAMLKAWELPLEAALAFERDAFAGLFATADRREGIAAFREKRKPVFRGE
jgi:enoyl-CoA hydratase